MHLTIINVQVTNVARKIIYIKGYFRKRYTGNAKWAKFKRWIDETSTKA